MTLAEILDRNEEDIALDKAVELSLTSGEEARIDCESAADYKRLILAMYSVRSADVVVFPGYTHMSGEAYLGGYSVWAFHDCDPAE